MDLAIGNRWGFRRAINCVTGSVLRWGASDNNIKYYVARPLFSDFLGPLFNRICNPSDFENSKYFLLNGTVSGDFGTVVVFDKHLRAEAVPNMDSYLRRYCICCLVSADPPFLLDFTESQFCRAGTGAGGAATFCSSRSQSFLAWLCGICRIR
jgi:hypothetical protein